MAAPVVVRSSGPALCPSFAEVCSFLERYGAALDLPEITFPQMERYLRDTTTGERSLAVLLLGRGSGGKLRHLKPKEYTTTTITIVMMMKMTKNVELMQN